MSAVQHISLNANFNQLVGTSAPAGNYVGDPINPWYPDWWQPVIKEYYPVYLNTWSQNKTDQAFRVARKLIENGYVKPETVKNFIDLVMEISAEL